MLFPASQHVYPETHQKSIEKNLSTRGICTTAQMARPALLLTGMGAAVIMQLDGRSRSAFITFII